MEALLELQKLCDSLKYQLLFRTYSDNPGWYIHVYNNVGRYTETIIKYDNHADLEDGCIRAIRQLKLNQPVYEGQLTQDELRQVRALLRGIVKNT